MVLGKKAWIILLVILAAVMTLGCAEERTKLSVKSSYPACYVGTEYDAKSLIETESGATYTVTAYYIENQEIVKLTVKGTKFTATKAGKITVRIVEDGSGSAVTVELKVVKQESPNDDGDDDNNDDNDDDDDDTFEDEDLSVRNELYSVPVLNYGVESSIKAQGNVVKKGASALQVTIPSRDNYTGGNGTNRDVWSWLCIPLWITGYSYTQSLTDMYMTYSVKFDNSFVWNSFILVDSFGTYSKEYGITMGGKGATFYSRAEANGWYDVVLNFGAVTGEPFSQIDYPPDKSFDLSQVVTIMLTVSNSGKDTSREAKIYYDDMYITDDISSNGAEFDMREVYRDNPNQDIETDILFLGNSFIYSSDIGAILQSIADDNGKPLRVESYSKGNGTASELYGIGFGQYTANQYNTWGRKLFGGQYDLVFVQAGFFGYSDSEIALFADYFATNYIPTRVVMLPAYNERHDVAEYSRGTTGYLINWGRLNDKLIEAGLTQWDLNQAADDWHANALSGYAASVMIFYALYEEMPYALNAVHNKLMSGYYIYGSSIAPYSFNMRGTTAEKTARFQTIQNVARQLVVERYYYIDLPGN